ncbi:hypothetical protein STEG23_012515, partial [Scotinomys teguina]
MYQLSWFLDPGGWGKAAAVGLYFIFAKIYTLSLGISEEKKDEFVGTMFPISHLSRIVSICEVKINLNSSTSVSNHWKHLQVRDGLGLSLIYANGSDGVSKGLLMIEVAETTEGLPREMDIFKTEVPESPGYHHMKNDPLPPWRADSLTSNIVRVITSHDIKRL